MTVLQRIFGWAYLRCCKRHAQSFLRSHFWSWFWVSPSCFFIKSGISGNHRAAIPATHQCTTLTQDSCSSSRPRGLQPKTLRPQSQGPGWGTVAEKDRSGARASQRVSSPGCLFYLCKATTCTRLLSAFSHGKKRLLHRTALGWGGQRGVWV